MISRKNQTGFSAVALILILAVMAGVGFAGYSFYSRQSAKTADTTNQQNSAQPASSSSSVKPAPKITETSDLDKAQKILDETDPAASSKADSKQLDSELTAF